MEQSRSEPDWPPGSSEMARLIREHDWAATSLGPPEAWPERLRGVVDLVLASGFPMVALWGPDLVQIYNDGYARIMGQRHPAGLGQPTRECWPEVWHINEPIYERVRAGETVTFEDALYPLTREAGIEDAWFTLSYSPLRDESGAVAGVLVTVVETTDRLRADKRQQESERRLLAVLEQGPLAIAVTGPAGEIVFRNETFDRLWGRPAHETTAESYSAVYEGYHLDGRPIASHEWPGARAVLQGRVIHGEVIEIVNLSGRRIACSFNAGPIRDEAGRITGGVVMFRDVTEERRMQVALERQSEERYRAIVETATDYAIFTTDAEGRIETWPKGAEEVFGWTAEEAVGQLADITFTPEDREKGEPEKERQQARSRGHAPDVRWHVRKDGSRVFIDGVVRPLTSADGSVSGFVKVGQDVTERWATEAALRESEARFRQFGDATADVLWIRNAETLEFEYVSPAFEEVYGAPLDSILGGNHVRRWVDLILSEDRALALDHLRRVREGEHVLTSFRVRLGDGQVRWIRDTGFPILDEQARVQRVAGIGHDATEEVELHDRLRVLVAELQHRSRNLVTVVQGVAERTLATSQALGDFRTRFRARLAALGRVNGLLSRLEEGHRITFDQLLRTELAAHGVIGSNGEGEQVRLGGPRGVRLRSATVQTFALAIHELATNALKHGALLKPEGRLDVRWSLLPGKGGEQRLQVDWRETGVRPTLASKPMDSAPVPQRQGYGRELIERALPYQLKAQTDYQITPEGVRCTIILPVSSTLDVAFSSQGDTGEANA